jgi:hypothetical protein
MFPFRSRWNTSLLGKLFLCIILIEDSEAPIKTSIISSWLFSFIGADNTLPGSMQLAAAQSNPKVPCIMLLSNLFCSATIGFPAGGGPAGGSPSGDSSAAQQAAARRSRWRIYQIAAQQAAHQAAQQAAQQALRLAAHYAAQLVAHLAAYQPAA